MKLYLKEAIFHAKSIGVENPKQKIIDKIDSWKNAKRPEQNLSNVLNGHTQANPEIIRTFCQVCKVSSDFIYFGKPTFKDDIVKEFAFIIRVIISCDNIKQTLSVYKLINNFAKKQESTIQMIESLTEILKIQESKLS